MTRAGVLVDDLISCPGLDAGVAADHLVRIISVSGSYRAVRVGPDRLQVARTFRPTWATVTGILGIPVFFIGIVFFFVKTTEMCQAVLEEDHRGTRIRLTGKLDRDVLHHLRAAFDDPAAAAAAIAAAGAVGAPIASPYDLRSSVPASSNSPASPPWASTRSTPPPPTPPPLNVRSAPPVGGAAASGAPGPMPAAAADVRPGWRHPSPGERIAAVADGDEELLDATRAVPSRPGTMANGTPRLVFDDGNDVPAADRLVLVGRDPAAGPDETDVHLVSVDDLSVSKTHVAIVHDGSAIWVMDRHSTNGTRLVTTLGEAQPLTPGQWVQLLPGTAVEFGERMVRVAGDAAPAGGGR